MVILSRIYTRTGDDGTTGLGDGSRVAKTDARLEAFADVDEASSAIGVAIALGSLPPAAATLLTRIQNDLFDVGADLCRPITPAELAGSLERAPLRVAESDVARLENACDAWNELLAPLQSFVLPGGTPGAALLHVARTVVRRAERATWAAIAAHGDSVSAVPARYLNRLSDLLFVLARCANADGAAPVGDVLWLPGGSR